MLPSPNTSESRSSVNELLAALMFFTRLPFWRIKQVPATSFNHVVTYWSLSGWLTGGTMVLTFVASSLLFPPSVALILAFIARLLLTGALHEDGLADFFDGFGGGRDRESTLRIMKDSHIGSYGVLGLILYYLLSFHSLSSLPPHSIPLLLWATDAWSKALSAQLINRLPYARTAETSKNKTVYATMQTKDYAISLAGGMVPLLFLPLPLTIALLIPTLMTFALMCYLFKKRLDGYTGDCCGALFLLCELSARMGVLSYYTIYPLL